MNNLIKIAADSIETLRKCDVYRVLEQNSALVRDELANFISVSRPDLADEVSDCLEEF